MTQLPSSPASARLGRFAGALALCFVLAACSTGPGESGPATSGAPEPAPAASAGQASAGPADEPVPAAEESARQVRTALEELAAAAPKPTSEQMVAAMSDAGFDESSIEVSADITPTGLAVDAIEAASPIDDNCIIGQVRDGKVAVRLLPVLASGKCFVGGAS